MRPATVCICLVLAFSGCSSPPDVTSAPDRDTEASTPPALAAEPDRPEVSPAPIPAALLSDARFDALRAELQAARAAQVAGDHDGARAIVAAAIERALEDLAERDDSAACALFEELGRFAHQAGALGPAVDARAGCTRSGRGRCPTSTRNCRRRGATSR